MTDKEVNLYLQKWQAILKLDDWDIKISLVEEKWRKSGDIKIDQSNKVAILMLNVFNPKIENKEAIIIHELVHLKLWKIDQLTEDLIDNLYGADENDPKRNLVYGMFMTILEQTTEGLTRSFIDLAAENKEIPFGYVEEELRKELKDNN